MKTNMRINEASICRLCLEPVHNFICTDCLFQNVKKWVSHAIPHKAEYVNALLNGKHDDIKKMLGNEQNRGVCMSCRQMVDEIACPCCYLYEMQSVIKEHTSRDNVNKFEENLNFDFTFHHGMSQLNLWESIHGRLLSTKSFKPIVITDARRSLDMGMCENCEVESTELSDSGGKLLCETCRDEHPTY